MPGHHHGVGCLVSTCLWLPDIALWDQAAQKRSVFIQHAGGFAASGVVDTPIASGQMDVILLASNLTDSLVDEDLVGRFALAEAEE